MANDIVIGTGGKTDKPLANFAKKEKAEVSPSILKDESVNVPPIYYWEDVCDGKSVLMTMAFKWKGRNWGMSYPIEDDNMKKREICRKKLFRIVKESMDILVHHGEKVLDSTGNIDSRLVNDQEALRFKMDPIWDKRILAFNQLVKIKPITKKRAEILGLLN
jgi:hypothetical protein